MLTEDLADRLTVKRIQDLLRKYGQQTSYPKQELIDRMSTLVSQGMIPVSAVDDFLAEEISHGKNRLLFISMISSTIVDKLRSKEYIMRRLQECGYPTNNFNNIRTNVNPEDMTLVYLYLTESTTGNVNIIDMCFTKRVLVEGLVDEDGEEIPPKIITDYIWVNINVLRERIVIKLKPARSIGFGENSKSKDIHDEVYYRVAEVFLIPPMAIGYTKNLTYKIFRDLTQIAEKPFQEKVLPLSEDIVKFSQDCASKLGLREDPINLPHRLSRLFERALIQENFPVYQSYTEGKVGVVARIAFSDQTGAKVNARSGDSDGIEMADIYFDTRDTIDAIKGVDRIWVDWFYLSNLDNGPERIGTKLEASKYYYIVHFRYKYTTKEVEEFVLSQIERYETLPD